MRSESWPRRPAAKYLLLLLGLVPFGEIAYIAGPKALVPVAVGVVAALLTGLRILKRVERISKGSSPWNNRSHAARKRRLAPQNGVMSHGRREDGAA